MEERRLWIAVLADGMIGAYYGELEDLCWISSDHDGVGSAVWVCVVLGLEIEEMRDRVTDMRTIKQLLKLYPHLRYPRRCERGARVGDAGREMAVVGPTRMMLPGLS